MHKTSKKKAAKKPVAPPKPLPQRGGKRALAEAARTLDAPAQEAATEDKAAKRLAKKNVALDAEVAAAPDAPHIEARLHVGEMSVVVDAYSLERTIGAGMWGHGRGLADAWPDTVWAGLLAHLGLPAFPLDRATADRPVKRLVQRLWYEACGGGVPADRAATFVARDAEAEAAYKEELPKAEAAAKVRKERAKTSFGAKGETSYTPTVELKKAAPKGQAATLLAFFKASKWAATTTSAAAAGMVAHGLVTTTKPERIAAFYLCDFAKRGWLTRSVEGVAGE